MLKDLRSNRSGSARIQILGRILCGFPLLAVTALAGCGREPVLGARYEVKGKVLLANGKPLSKGRVTIVPKEGVGMSASGPIKPDGSFTLTTKSSDDGAIPGEYKFRIEPEGGKKSSSNRLAFPLKYIDEDSSGVVVTVRAESNKLEPIRLK